MSMWDEITRIGNELHGLWSQCDDDATAHELHDAIGAVNRAWRAALKAPVQELNEPINLEEL